MTLLKDIPIFFVVGRPRSGTTLLRTLFDAHPNVSFPPECQFIINLFPRYGRITNWKESDIISFYNDLINQWLFDTWKIDNVKLQKRLLKFQGPANYSTICKAVYLEYNSLFDKENIILLGDKNPGYTIYTKQLQKIFPEAKFIHLLRDYRDNFVSIKNVDFELPLPSVVAQKWKYFYKKFNLDSKTEPDRYKTIKYEDLVNDPEKKVRELCDFIGIEYNESVFNFHRKKDKILETYPKGYIRTYHTSLLQKINPSKIGVWKSELTDKQVRLMDYTIGSYAEKAGYIRKYRKNNILIKIAAFPGRSYAALLYVATIAVDKLPYKLRSWILIKGPMVIASFYLRVFNPKKLDSFEMPIIKKTNN